MKLSCTVLTVGTIWWLCYSSAVGSRLEPCSQILGQDSVEEDSVTNPDIVYYRTTQPGSSEYMHYAWSMVGFPTLFLSYSSGFSPCDYINNHTNLTAFRNDQSYGSVGIPGANGTFSMAVVLHALIEFGVNSKNGASNVFNTTEAVDGTGEFTRHPLNSSKLHWLFNNGSRTFYLNESSADGTTYQDLQFQIRVVVPRRTGSDRLGYLPKTLYTENSTVFDLLIRHFNYSYNYSRNRLALELLLVHGPQTSNGSVSFSRSIDDEYTPSIFETYKYRFGRENISNTTSTSKGFIVWKPISYQTGGRKSTSSQQATVVLAEGSAQPQMGAKVPRSLASALFNNSTASNITRMFIVFGTSGDETFINSTYMTWTAVVGYGKAPHEKISFVVIITIILGLGIPGFLVMVGAVYVVYKKKPWENIARWTATRKRRGDYSRLS